MGIELGNEINNLINRINTSLKSGVSVSSSDDEIFSEYLKKNYDKIDSDKDKSLSKEEIEATIKNSDDDSVKKLLAGNKLEGLITSLDMNKNGFISTNELNTTNTQASLTDVFKSAIQKFGGSSDVGVAAGNLSQKFLSAYGINSSASKLVTSAVNMIL